MRSRLALIGVLILAGCSSCSYEAKRKTESAVEQAAEKFHEKLNEEQYQTIYYEADAELRNRVTEADFTDQLRSAHEQLGRVSGKVYVFIDEKLEAKTTVDISVPGLPILWWLKYCSNSKSF